MPQTPRQIINEARRRVGSDDLSFEAFSLGSAPARDAVAFYNNVLRDFKNQSVDLRFNEVFTDVSLLTDTTKVLIANLSDTVDIDMIKYLKYNDTTNKRLVDLYLITAERAEELIALEASKGIPRFYYEKNKEIHVLPTADANYTLKIGYQKEITLATDSSVDTVVPFSQKWESIAVDGVEAYMKERFGHRDRDTVMKEYKMKLEQTARLLNKWDQKKQGIRRNKIVTRRRTRRIF